MPHNNVATPVTTPYAGPPDEARRAQEASRWLDFVTTSQFSSGIVVAAGVLLTDTVLLPYPNSLVLLSGYYEAAAGATIYFSIDGTQVSPTFKVAANITSFPWYVATVTSAGLHTVTMTGSQNSVICGLQIRRGRNRVNA